MKIIAKFFKRENYPFGNPDEIYTLYIEKELFEAFCYHDYTRIFYEVISKKFIRDFGKRKFPNNYFYFRIEDLQSQQRWHIKSIIEEFNLNIEQIAGTPDFFYGDESSKKHIWIEVKVANDSLRKNQIEWISKYKLEEIYILKIDFENDE